MPVYEYKCPNCGCEESASRPIDQRDRLAPWCLNCGETMERRLSAPAVNMNGQEAAK